MAKDPEAVSVTDDRLSTFGAGNAQKDSASASEGPIRTSHHLWQIRPVQDLLWAAMIAAMIWFGYELRGIFVPILIGLTAAYIANPLFSYLEDHWNVPRSIPIAAVLAVLVILAIVTCLFFLPMLASELNQLSAKAPRYAETLSAEFQDRMDADWVSRLKNLAGQLPQDNQSLMEYLFVSAGKTMGIVADVAGSIAYLLSAAALIPVYFCFFAWNFRSMLKQVNSVLPQKHRELILRLAGRMDSVVGSFVRGRCVVVLAMMLMFSVGYMFAGVPYWFLLGSFTGLLSFVPYLAVVGCAVTALVTWVDAAAGGGGELSVNAVLLWPVAAYSIVQLIEGWLITPWVQSQSTDMSAVTILVVLMIGGSVAGVYGLLLSIPAAGCCRVLAEELLLPELKRRAGQHSSEQAG